ncbi:hypothetical protein Pmani_020420 [Petrolisthes manimaculis]|uniref:Uncharacterized protein n=1 Tax=Petrolisthes manimaculis TaxID=1843537 RepID=A0AAE1U4G4_9EUCA|nr:hypothetical protein Pmani_020420 [Petrolisthes manimaculis]
MTRTQRKGTARWTGRREHNTTHKVEHDEGGDRTHGKEGGTTRKGGHSEERATGKERTLGGKDKGEEKHKRHDKTQL